MIGQKFGRLLVITPAPAKHNRARWNCHCDCGGVCVATGKALRTGKKKSCGCLKKEAARSNARKMTAANVLPFGESAINQLYATYRWHALNRNLAFSLTLEQFGTLIQRNCWYCGIAPKQKRDGFLGTFFYNGVDREDNQQGYVSENCVACCKTCNDMKRTRTVDEFISACAAVTDFQKKRARDTLRLSLPKLV